MCASTNNTPDFVTLSSFPRAIAHVDCDAFFTSCEQARDPRLKGKPVVTGQERGIISCPSYEAKQAGVTRAMRLHEARRICPGLIVLPSDYELYSIYSERIFAVIRRFTPDVQEYSIDEAFCDLTGLRRMYRASYADIALKIKATIQGETGITVSVGLSLSKTLAKICSKQNKPDGFLAMPGYKLHEFLPKVPLERVCGFGPATVALLTKYGIKNVLDFTRRPREFAEKLLGKTGLELWQELNGQAVYQISTETKHTYLTISKTKTFMPASNDRDVVKAQVMRNLESAFIKLRRHELSAKKLVVYLRKTDFRDNGIEGQLNRHSASTLDFTAVCSQLFDRVFEQGAVYRATGVVLGDIVTDGVDATDLFEDPVRVKRLRTLSAVVDEVNDAFGKHTLHVASSQAVTRKAKHSRNTLTWRKQELLKGETFRKRLGIPLLKLR